MNAVGAYTAAGFNLRTGDIKSCGCLKKEVDSKRLLTHGLSKTPEYKVYLGIKKRCFNPKCKSYVDYGERGISICDRWLEAFENFLEDMGPRPSKYHSIERKDNDGNYEPGNCYWATRKEQANNRRPRTCNKLYSFAGKNMSLGAWAQELKISRNTLEKRLRSGWTVEKTFSTPIDTRQSRKAA